MVYNHENQKILNQGAVDNPKPGDYWHEMFCPYFLVVRCQGNKVTVLSCIEKNDFNARIVYENGTWEFDLSKFMIVDREWIKEKVTYSHCKGFVADVINSEKTQRIAKDWIQSRAQKLLEEFNNLGPEASKYLLQKS